MLHHFLVNPAAGKGKITDALIRRIHSAAKSAGVEYTVHITSRPGDATDYVRKAVAARADIRHRFYACGGDGTLCETINGAPTAENAEFAVVPVGTGNDFARNFSNPEYFFDIKRQIEGESVRIDLMRYNDRYSLNTLNVGFDSNAAKKTGEIKRNPMIPSRFAYTAGLAITLCKPFGTKMKIELPSGETYEESFLLAVAANGSYYGGGFNPAPCASLCDGLIDLCMIKKMTRTRFLRLVSSYKNGTYLENPAIQSFITYCKTPSVRLLFEKPVSICVDGENEMTDHVEITCVPSALAFSIPNGAALLPPKSASEEASATDTPSTTEEVGATAGETNS